MCQGQLRNNPVFYLLVVLFWLFKVSCFYCLKCLNLKSPIMYCKVDILEPNDPNNWEWPWCPNSLLTWLGNWVTSMRFPGTLMGKSGLYWQIPWGQRGAQWPGLTHLQFCYKAHDSFSATRCRVSASFPFWAWRDCSCRERFPSLSSFSEMLSCWVWESW